MSKEEGFIQAILAAPRDDELRLIFADWLEDRNAPGDAARAEFIRLTVREPQKTFWGSSDAAEHSNPDRAATLCRENWQNWMETLRLRVADSPLRRWLGARDCRWGYRRGFVAVFEGTQQVVLDAWDDLFRLGPIEEVQVNSLWHFGTVLSLRLFLDRPSMRVLRLRAEELRDDCVDQLRRVSDWLRRLERVELIAENYRGSTAAQLVAWLAADPSLRRIDWQPRQFSM